MNIFSKAHITYLVLTTALTWNRRNTHYGFFLPGNPKFMGPRDAVKLIRDGAVIATSGLAANQRPSIVYWAIRELFQETGHPCNLTVEGTGGQGGRGRAPGTAEELGLPGLCTRVVVGHIETFKKLLKLGEDGQAELHCIPQGIVARLLEAQGRGEDSLATFTGVNTFMDPRVGRGSPVTEKAADQFVAVEGGQLRYHMPKVDVAVFNAYAADREGNIYVTHCPMKAEIREITLAAKRNGGIVIANVSRVVEKDPEAIYVSADLVDAVVVYPKTEQSCYVPYDKQLTFLTQHSTMSREEGIARSKLVNQIMGLTPRRNKVDTAIARLASTIFADSVPRGALVNIGVGLPEEVCRILLDCGVVDQITLFTESGVIGGVPAPGVFFGAAVRAERVVSSAEVFKMCAERLDTTVLGVLQADSEGNVNVSKRSERIGNYVGPGGFIDLTTAAKTVIFVTKWMEREKMRFSGGQMQLVEPGKAKFVDRVDEITFSGREALKAGKTVFYVTSVGVFTLTARGMELIRVMPGIDIQRDILAKTAMKVVLPENGQVPTIDRAILKGKGFRPTLREPRIS